MILKQSIEKLKILYPTIPQNVLALFIKADNNKTQPQMFAKFMCQLYLERQNHEQIIKNVTQYMQLLKQRHLPWNKFNFVDAHGKILNRLLNIKQFLEFKNKGRGKLYQTFQLYIGRILDYKYYLQHPEQLQQSKNIDLEDGMQIIWSKNQWSLLQFTKFKPMQKLFNENSDYIKTTWCVANSLSYFKDYIQDEDIGVFLNKLQKRAYVFSGKILKNKLDYVDVIPTEDTSNLSYEEVLRKYGILTSNIKIILDDEKISNQEQQYHIDMYQFMQKINNTLFYKHTKLNEVDVLKFKQYYKKKYNIDISNKEEVSLTKQQIDYYIKNSNLLSKFNIDQQSQLELIKKDYKYLSYIKNLKYQLCLVAVKQDGSALRYVPQKFKTQQMCLTVVKKYGSALYYVPQKFRTQQLCLVAVKQNGFALKYVPQKFKTQQMCWTAVKQYGPSLQSVPQKLKTQQICLVAVKQSGYALEYVPQKFKTQQICLVAVKQDGLALEHVPQKFKTQQMCWTAVKNFSAALYYVPQKYKTYQICLAAVKQDGSALYYVPQKLKTYQFYLAAVKQNGSTLRHVPQKYKTQQMCIAAVKQDGLALEHVPQKFRTQQICIAAVKQFAWALEFVPQKLKTYQLCLTVVKQHGSALHFVPQKFMTQQMCIAAVKTYGQALKYIPQKLKTYQLCLAAVKQYGSALHYVPQKYKDKIKRELNIHA